MGPKKVTADKGKEQEITGMEESEDTRMDRLEEELQGLREKLAYADKQIIDTKLQSLTESNRLAELLRQQEEIHRQERETLRVLAKRSWHRCVVRKTRLSATCKRE